MLGKWPGISLWTSISARYLRLAMSWLGCIIQLVYGTFFRNPNIGRHGQQTLVTNAGILGHLYKAPPWPLHELTISQHHAGSLGRGKSPLILQMAHLGWVNQRWSLHVSEATEAMLCDELQMPMQQYQPTPRAVKCRRWVFFKNTWPAGPAGGSPKDRKINFHQNRRDYYWVIIWLQ